MREIRGGVFQGRFHNLLISKNNTFWAPQISRITFQVVYRYCPCQFGLWQGSSYWGRMWLWGPCRSSWLCVETLPRGVCLDPRLLYNFTAPRFGVELPREPLVTINHGYRYLREGRTWLCLLYTISISPFQLVAIYSLSSGRERALSFQCFENKN